MTEKNATDTIKLQTTRFGELEVPQESIIEIEAGIIGFAKAKKYVMLDYNPPFSWLQSVDIPELAFVVVNATEFGENYSFRLPTEDPYLDLTTEDDVAIMVLVSVRPPPIDTTGNLKAPIIVNLRNRHGLQIILEDPQFSMRFPLWAKEEEEEGTSAEK